MNMKKKKLRWINDDEPIFIEDTVRNYAHRTWENAEWSDITMALAVDMSSPGEKTTRRAAGERYVGFVLPEDLAGRNLPALANAIGRRLKRHPNFKREGLKLNIAGNSQITLDRFGIEISQVRSLLRCVLQDLVDEGVDIAMVRSGGQTGVDEAGIQAAQDVGLRCSVLAPKGFRMHREQGVELEGRAQFVSRFLESE